MTIVVYIENDGVKAKMETDVIKKKKNNITAKMNTNMNELIIITSTTMIFDI